MSVRPFLRSLFAVLAGAVPAFAGHFVADNALDFRALIAPPPAADSLVTRAELDVVLQFQDLRTPALAKRAQEIENETLFGFGADVVGPWFTAERLPKTAALFAAVREDFLPVNRASKALWPRQRPALRRHAGEALRRVFRQRLVSQRARHPVRALGRAARRADACAGGGLPAGARSKRAA
ncbi:MAG: hypothetical protein WDM96_07915 [Lacunisphaera sp.]